MAFHALGFGEKALTHRMQYRGLDNRVTVTNSKGTKAKAAEPFEFEKPEPKPTPAAAKAAEIRAEIESRRKQEDEGIRKKLESGGRAGTPQPSPVHSMKSQGVNTEKVPPSPQASVGSGRSSSIGVLPASMLYGTDRPASAAESRQVSAKPTPRIPQSTVTPIHCHWCNAVYALSIYNQHAASCRDKLASVMKSLPPFMRRPIPNMPARMNPSRDAKEYNAHSKFVYENHVLMSCPECALKCTPTVMLCHINTHKISGPRQTALARTANAAIKAAGDHFVVETPEHIAEKQHKDDALKSDPTAAHAVQYMRRMILSKMGPEGVRGLRRQLALADASGDGELDRKELNALVIKCGLNIDNNTLKAVVKALDTDGSGTVSLREFTRGMLGTMNEKRQAALDEVYKLVDADGNGTVSIAEIRKRFNPDNHPDVLSGKITPLVALGSFLRTWDTMADGSITKKDFCDAYNDISTSMESDDDFIFLLKSCWTPPKSKVAPPPDPTKMRVQVTFVGGKMEVVEIQSRDGQPLRRDTMAAKRRLSLMGYSNINRIVILD